ncbi:ral-GDS-related protein-like isoform X1 [Macaca thibetana thibetana]|uniref:ral-GDS-related protein-like isoform X1 n=1 Tax=Macaca thibetana thibetana TaxID=257877 RepID=UPI0021BCBFF2|nr:ral-GDS-related protein-like isoform X1 [Macaca thibetana thibetana]
MSNLLTNQPGAAVLSAQVHSAVLQGHWEENVSGTLGRRRVRTALLHGQVCPFQDSTDGLGTTGSILFTWPPENTSVCCQALQRSSFWIKLAFRTFTWPGLGLEDHQGIVLGQLVLPEPKEAKPDDPAPPPGQHALTMLALEPAPPLLAELPPALEPESPVALDAQGYLHSTPAPAPGEGPPPGTVLEPQSAPESPCPCPGTVKSQHTEERPDITTFPPRLLAEQLTLIDAELFKKVELYECMGSIWGQRHQKGSEHVAPTVCATIAHFNRLTNCVTTSCLGDHSMRAQDRARVVEHWIKVARECLRLNNFSSVHAIVSALRSNPIHRLHKTWAGVSSKSTKYLKELCKKDTAVKRDLLIKAGSFKVATQERNPQRAQMRLRRQNKGVVPFLGDFLTELHRLDSAIPDDLDGNSNKRRKEVRVLQEMQLLQVAAMNYRLRPLEKFVTCFSRMEQLSEKERWGFTMMSRLVSNSWPQAIHPPQPPKVLTVQLQAVLSAGARIPVGWKHPAVAGALLGCWPEHQLCIILHPDQRHQETTSRWLAAQLHLDPAPQYQLLLLARVRPWDFCMSGGKPFYVYFL